MPAQAAEDPWSLSFVGHARTYVMAGRTTVEQLGTGSNDVSGLYVALQRLRPTAEIWWDDFVGLEIAYDVIPMFRTSSGAASLSEFAVNTTHVLRLVDMDPELVGGGTGKWELRHNLDRLNIRIGQPGLEVQIGRQAINHGSARMFPSTDLFAPFGPGTIDSEFKMGVDAIRFTGTIGEYHEVEVYVVANELSLEDGVEPDNWMYLARWRGTFPELFDVSVFGGLTYKRPTLGVDVSTQWLGAAIFGEASARLKVDEAQSTALRATLGVDYYWEIGLQTLLELHYSSPGSSTIGANISNPSFEHGIGEVSLLSNWYVGTSASYTWRLYSFGAGAIVNLQDASTMFTLNVLYDLTENMVIGVGALLPLGAAPQLTSSLSEGMVDLQFSSEFGMYPMLGYLDVRVAF
jgi:hypothetical protein